MPIVLCDKCDRARNPKSTLGWHKQPDGGWLCANCHTPPLPEPQIKGPELVVIDCPACKYVPLNMVDEFGCISCNGLRVVRVAPNTIPVYTKTLVVDGPKLLTEGS